MTCYSAGALRLCGCGCGVGVGSITGSKAQSHGGAVAPEGDDVGKASANVSAERLQQYEIWNGHTAEPITDLTQTNPAGSGKRRPLEGSKPGCHLSLQGNACSVQTDRPDTGHVNHSSLCRGNGPETCRVWLCSKCHSSQFQGSGHFSGGAEITNSAL